MREGPSGHETMKNSGGASPWTHLISVMLPAAWVQTCSSVSSPALPIHSSSTLSQKWAQIKVPWVSRGREETAKEVLEGLGVLLI